MKKYNFRLQKIMEFKQHKEKEKQRELASAKQELTKEETKLLDLNCRKGGCQKELLEKNNSKLDVSELLVYYTYLIRLTEEIADQMHQVHRLEENVERKRQLLAESSKEKKILERLRGKDYASYRKELGKVEQKLMDELANLHPMLRGWESSKP